MLSKNKTPKALTSYIVGKTEWGKIVKRKKKSERRERKIKEWEKGNKMVYVKNANGPSILLIINYRSLTTMSNNH